MKIFSGNCADGTIPGVPENDSHGEIRSEPHGPHWIAWRADANGKPEGAIVIVGETREEAESRAVRWMEQNAR
jgi:hypothetical protein